MNASHPYLQYKDFTYDIISIYHTHSIFLFLYISYKMKNALLYSDGQVLQKEPLRDYGIGRRFRPLPCKQDALSTGVYTAGLAPK